MPRLHINIDHVATLRQARRGFEPDPIAWALEAERAGAQGITCHLRKDRRHIQDADVVALRAQITTLLNLELSLDPEIVELSLTSGADEFCLVPENRKEVTTEGGLDVLGEAGRLALVIPKLLAVGGVISLFIDPEPEQVRAAAGSGAQFIELHTGSYSNAEGLDIPRELRRLSEATNLARELGLRVNAGHGLNYLNVGPVALLDGIEELNIGHSIVSRAIFCGIHDAVGDMKALVAGADGIA
jgi:pyridoxine 5-phosphate synthase